MEHMHARQCVCNHVHTCFIVCLDTYTRAHAAYVAAASQGATFVATAGATLAGAAVAAAQQAARVHTRADSPASQHDPELARCSLPT
jgi:hypothetical protein